MHLVQNSVGDGEIVFVDFAVGDSEFVEASASGDGPLVKRVSIKIYLDALKARLGSDEYSILYDKYGLGLTYKALGEKYGLSLDQACTWSL